MQTFKAFMKCHPTRIGLIFALLVPMLFTIIWMTGYRGADTRINRIDVAIVNEAGLGGEAVMEQLTNSAPFSLRQAERLDITREQMKNGEWSMVISIPKTFANGHGEINFEIREDASDVVKSMLEKSAHQLTDALSKDIQTNAVQANIVRIRTVGDFSATALPMLLGFIPYIAMMTANI